EHTTWRSRVHPCSPDLARAYPSCYLGLALSLVRESKRGVDTTHKLREKVWLPKHWLFYFSVLALLLLTRALLLIAAESYRLTMAQNRRRTCHPMSSCLTRSRH